MIIPWRSVLTLWRILGMAAYVMVLYLVFLAWGLLSLDLGG